MLLLPVRERQRKQTQESTSCPPPGFRVTRAAAAAAATSVRSSTLLFDVALSRMPVRAFGEKCDEVHALTELNDVNPINSNVDSFIILKSIFL